MSPQNPLTLKSHKTQYQAHPSKYMNDIPADIPEIPARLYADDMVLYHYAKNTNQIYDLRMMLAHQRTSQERHWQKRKRNSLAVTILQVGSIQTPARQPKMVEIRK